MTVGSVDPVAVTTARCPSCAARCRSDDTWCTLCHTRLDELPEPDVPDMPDVPVAVPGQVLVSGPVGADLPEAVLDQLDEMVAALAAQERGLVLPGIAGLTAARTATRGGQAMIATVGVAVVVGSLLVVMTVLGLFV